MKKTVLLLAFCAALSPVAFGQTGNHGYDNATKEQRYKEEAQPMIPNVNSQYTLMECEPANKEEDPMAHRAELLYKVGMYTGFSPEATTELPLFRKAEYKYGILLLHTPGKVRL